MQLVMLSAAVRLGGLYFRKDLVNIYGMLRHISRSSPLACFTGTNELYWYKSTNTDAVWALQGITRVGRPYACGAF